MANPRARGASWLWRNDEEMAKKDDDLNLHTARQSRHGGQWHASRPPRRSAVVRLGFYILIFITLVALYKTFSSSSSSGTYSSGSLPLHSYGVGAAGADNGPIRFPDLPSSLRALTQSTGAGFLSPSVLFAAASLRSASTLLPLACLMAKDAHNPVHFVFVSRSNIPLKDLLTVNGIDDACEVMFHDARPTNAAANSETRMALASALALFHMNKFVHPKAVIVDATAAEEAYLLSGIRDQVKTTKASLIELPDRPEDRLRWITKLDSVALGFWDRVHFDILVHAPTSGSGSLNRLLRSLARADLSAVSVPHLTVELPPDIPTTTSKLLADFKWPPEHMRRPGQQPMLSLRHRISRQKITEEESSVRFLESFWPNNPEFSHVLVLSPDTEVSPEFFHYVKYMILQYRYSSSAITEYSEGMRMMGISFSSPNMLLDGTQPFEPPPGKGDTPDAGTPYRWQAPSSDAMLFIGSKWTEIHGYISQVLEKQASWDSTEKPEILAQKQVSKKYPSWLEYVQQLARLRGYYTLYPSQATAQTLLGVHSELREAPEEYRDEQPDEKDSEGGSVVADIGVFDPGSRVDILATLPQDRPRSRLDALPLLSWNGKEIGLIDFFKASGEFTRKFRSEVGQCSEEDLDKDSTDSYARDLFCSKKGTTV